jgi:hypothetical protein
MVLHDKPNCQVSRILMNPRPILSDSSENHPGTISVYQLLADSKNVHVLLFEGQIQPFEVK